MEDENSKMVKIIFEYFMNLPESKREIARIFDLCTQYYLETGKWPTKEEIEEILP